MTSERLGVDKLGPLGQWEWIHFDPARFLFHLIRAGVQLTVSRLELCKVLVGGQRMSLSISRERKRGILCGKKEHTHTHTHTRPPARTHARTHAHTHARTLASTQQQQQQQQQQNKVALAVYLTYKSSSSPVVFILWSKFAPRMRKREIHVRQRQ